jgi:hypothetical protein
MTSAPLRFVDGPERWRFKKPAHNDGTEALQQELETALAGEGQKHLPGRHDQSTHGRGGRGPVFKGDPSKDPKYQDDDNSSNAAMDELKDLGLPKIKGLKWGAEQESDWENPMTGEVAPAIKVNFSVKESRGAPKTGSLKVFKSSDGFGYNLSQIEIREGYLSKADAVADAVEAVKGAYNL